MKKTIKFTPAKLASLKHPISKQPEKWYDLGCDGLAVFVMPQPSLKISYYASWSVVTYGADGKQKRSGRYKYLGRVGGSKNLEAIKQEIVNNLPVWKAPPPEPVTYILPYEPKSREPVYKSTGKFPKIDEAIAAAKKYID